MIDWCRCGCGSRQPCEWDSRSQSYWARIAKEARERYQQSMVNVAELKRREREHVNAMRSEWEQRAKAEGEREAERKKLIAQRATRERERKKESRLLYRHYLRCGGDVSDVVKHGFPLWRTSRLPSLDYYDEVVH